MTEAVRPEPIVPHQPLGPGSITDSELIELVRSGDSAAYEELFLRHRDVAIRYARRITDTERAEDLCAEAFTKIFDLLQRGKGPDVSFRAYLLTTVRTSHLNTLRTGNREELVPDHEPIGRMVPVIEDPDARFDRDAICEAFKQLPERWQVALWLTAVEGLSQDEASKHLGISPNAVASLTFRARAGLRQAYLAEHLLAITDPRCVTVVEQLPAYLRDRVTRRRRRAIEEHLETCASCRAAALELTEVDNRLGALLAPLALTGVTLGTAASGGSAVGVTAAIKGSVGTLLGHAKAAGSALPGFLSSKAAAVVTVTALGAAVGAEIIQHDAQHGPSTVTAVSPTLVGPATTSTPLGPRVARISTKPSPVFPTFSTAPSAAVLPPQVPPTPAPVVPSPTAPSPSRATPTATPRTMAIGSPTKESYQQNGARWERVSIPITDAPRGTSLVVTTDRTIQTTQPLTDGTGWVCGIPTTTWFIGSLYATTKIVCDHNAVGDGPAVRFNYNVIPGAVLRAEIIPPFGYRDSSLTDNLATLLLRS